MSRLPLGCGRSSPRASCSEEQHRADSIAVNHHSGWDDLAQQEAASSPMNKAQEISFHSTDVDMGRQQVQPMFLPQQALTCLGRNSPRTTPKQVSDSVSLGTVSPAPSLDPGSVASLPPKARSISRSRQSSPQATPTPHTRSSNESNQASAASVVEEANSVSPPQLSAKPQQVVINGEVQHLWSEHWGVTIGQVRDLLNASRIDPKWKTSNTMRDLVRDYIKPATAGQGMGYALLINKKKPLEVNVMVSHSWSENAEEFCESLERTVRQDDVLFICALSLFQNEDGSGPSIEDQLGGAAENSPFYRALRHIRGQNKRLYSKGRWFLKWVDVMPSLLLSVGLLLYGVPVFAKGCLPSLEYCYCPMGHSKEANDGHQAPGLMYDTTPLLLSSFYRPFILSAVATFLAVPLVWLCARCGRGTRPGYLLAVPNRQDDLYQRLWCVYEIFVAATLGVPLALANTLALAGTCSSLEATCSCDSDIDNIREEIKDWGRQQFGDDGHSGFVVIDRKIREVTYSGHWTTFFMMMRSMTPLAILCMICTQLELKSAKALAGPIVAANICGTKMGWAFLVAVVFFMVQKSQGRVPLRRLLLMVVVLLSPSIIFMLWKSAAKLDPEHSAGAVFLKKFGYAPFIGSELIAAHLVATQLSSCLKCNRKTQRFLAGVFLVTPVIYNVGKGVQGAGFPASFRDDGLPWVVFILSRLGYYVGILVFGIWAFTRWGVCIDPTQRICGCSGGCEKSLKRLRSSTSLGSDFAVQAPTVRFSNREGHV